MLPIEIIEIILNNLALIDWIKCRWSHRIFILYNDKRVSITNEIKRRFHNKENLCAYLASIGDLQLLNKYIIGLDEALLVEPIIRGSRFGHLEVVKMLLDKIKRSRYRRSAIIRGYQTSIKYGQSDITSFLGYCKYGELH